MNSDMFMQWVEKRLIPTFEKEYQGKKMIIIMDNAPYHHARAFKSFSALNSKPELIKELVGAGVEKVTLKAVERLPHHQESDVPLDPNSNWKEFIDEIEGKKSYRDYEPDDGPEIDYAENPDVTGPPPPADFVPDGVRYKQPPPPLQANLRKTDLRIDITKEVSATLENAVDDRDGATAVDETRAAKEWYYAATGKTGTAIPTVAELKEAAIVEVERMKNEDNIDLLKCKVQELLEDGRTVLAGGRVVECDGGHSIIWTPAYTPWLQPIETCVLPPPPPPTCALTAPACRFWAIGKNYSAKHNTKDRTMKDCITSLRAGWYGCEKYWTWVYAGKPKGGGLGGAGAPLTDAERLKAIKQRRASERKNRVGLDHRTIPLTAADWVPADCHAPANVPGLIEKVKGEANHMITNISGLSGTIEALTVDADAKIVTKLQRDM